FSFSFPDYFPFSSPDTSPLNEKCPKYPCLNFGVHSKMSPERQALGSAQWLAAEAEMLDRVRRIPGVRSASWATMNPMGGRDRGATLEIPGFTARAPRENDIHMAVVSPAYFETFGAPLLLGRALTE